VKAGGSAELCLPVTAGIGAAVIGGGANKDDQCGGSAGATAGQAATWFDALLAASSATGSNADSVSSWRKSCAAESSRAPDRSSL
jgi:hypothetical protein